MKLFLKRRIFTACVGAIAGLVICLMITFLAALFIPPHWWESINLWYIWLLFMAGGGILGCLEIEITGDHR